METGESRGRSDDAGIQGSSRAIGASALTPQPRPLFGGTPSPLGRPPRGALYERGDKEEPAMGNPFVHVELNTTDPGKAKAFYGRLSIGSSKTCRWGRGARTR